MELTDEIRAKRVAIARDVIENVQAGKYHMATGTGYIKTISQSKATDWRTVKGDMQPHVEKIAKECHVCNMGAYLLSKARLFDDVTISKYVVSYGILSAGRSKIVDDLADIFDKGTVALIELAFEADTSICRSTHWDYATKEEIDKAVEFGRIAGHTLLALARTADRRAVAVAENIIANNGEFKP